MDPCGALQCVFDLAEGKEHKLVFTLGVTAAVGGTRSSTVDTAPSASQFFGRSWCSGSPSRLHSLWNASTVSRDGRAYGASSYSDSEKPMLKVRTGSSTWRAIMATTALESVPPLKKAPTGTSLMARVYWPTPLLCVAVVEKKITRPVPRPWTVMAGILAATSGGMKKMSEERSEVLEYEPARFKVLLYVREVWSNAQGEIVTAPAPVKIIDKGLPGPALLAQVVLSKYRDHCPLALNQNHPPQQLQATQSGARLR